MPLAQRIFRLSIEFSQLFDGLGIADVLERIGSRLTWLNRRRPTAAQRQNREKRDSRDKEPQGYWTNSTRRFLARPSSVPFEVSGE